MIYEFAVMASGLAIAGILVWLSRRETKEFDARHKHHHPAE
ncbi:MAG: hypothetical protein ACPGNV_08765 [Mangrovicoccus sp.]